MLKRFVWVLFNGIVRMLLGVFLRIEKKMGLRFFWDYSVSKDYLLMGMLCFWVLGKFKYGGLILGVKWKLLWWYIIICLVGEVMVRYVIFVFVLLFLSIMIVLLVLNCEWDLNWDECIIKGIWFFSFGILGRLGVICRLEYIEIVL